MLESRLMVPRGYQREFVVLFLAFTGWTLPSLLAQHAGAIAVVPVAQAWQVKAAISDDGKCLAYLDGSKASLVDLSTHHRIDLAVLGPDPLGHSGIAFTHDGRHVYVTTPDLRSPGYLELVRFPTSGTGARGETILRHIGDFCLPSGSNEVLFHRRRWTSETFRSDLDGTHERPLSGQETRWCDAGGRIASVSYSQTPPREPIQPGFQWGRILRRSSNGKTVPLTSEDEHYHLIDAYPATLLILTLRQRFPDGVWNRVNALLMPQRIIWEIVVLKDTGE
jgi:hypothetical protein